MKKAIIILTVIIVFLSCSEDENLNLELGQFYQGGIIFYLDSTGEHGLVAAENDQASDAPWACHGAFYNITETEFDFGKQNTLDIIANINQDATCSPETYAAKICNDLVLEGYSDWFLPSYDELNLMYDNRTLIGNFNDTGHFTTTFYWSSTELNNIWGRMRSFGIDEAYAEYNNSGKDNPLNVRAVRKF